MQMMQAELAAQRALLQQPLPKRQWGGAGGGGGGQDSVVVEPAAAAPAAAAAGGSSCLQNALVIDGRALSYALSGRLAPLFLEVGAWCNALFCVLVHCQWLALPFCGKEAVPGPTAQCPFLSLLALALPFRRKG